LTVRKTFSFHFSVRTSCAAAHCCCCSPGFTHRRRRSAREPSNCATADHAQRNRRRLPDAVGRVGAALGRTVGRLQIARTQARHREPTDGGRAGHADTAQALLATAGPVPRRAHIDIPVETTARLRSRRERPTPIEVASNPVGRLIAQQWQHLRRARHLTVPRQSGPLGAVKPAEVKRSFSDAWLRRAPCETAGIEPFAQKSRLSCLRALPEGFVVERSAATLGW